MREPNAEYWQEVAAALSGPRAESSLWRACCDHLNARWLQPRLPREPAGSVLKTDLFDEATGEGQFHLLSGIASRIFGIDLSTATAAQCCHRWPVTRAAAADIRNLPFGDGSFDLVVSLSTLDHFRTVAGLRTGLAELHRVLRPGGRLLLTLDNRSNPVVALRNTLPWPLLRRAGLVPYYVGATLREGEIRRTLEQSGFQVRELGTLMHCPRVAAHLAAVAAGRFAGARFCRVFLGAVTAFERLARWPMARWTAYYLTAVAERP